MLRWLSETEQRRLRRIELIAAVAGLLGAALLASNTSWSPWGWVLFLASNAGWIAFACLQGFRWLLAMQIGFTATSLLGIWRWLL